MRVMILGEEFTYSGPANAWLKNPISGEIDFDNPYINIEISGTFVVDEYHSYEPSAYVWAPCVDVTFAWDDEPEMVFGITISDILDYYGICEDCNKEHGPDPTDCPYNMVD